MYAHVERSRPSPAACEACTTDVRASASLTQVYNRHCVLYEDTHKQLVSVHLPWLRALRRLRRVACRNGGDGAPRSTTTSRRLTISVLTAAAITTATTTAISLTTLTTTVADADRAK